MLKDTKTADNTATEQAAGDAVGTEAAPVSGEPVATAAPDEMKVWFRANVSWVMAEMNYLQMGKTADEREVLNP